METVFFLIIGVALAYGVGCLGRKRNIGFWWAFVFALLNLFLGLIIVLCSKKKNVDFVEVNDKEEER